MPKAVSTSGVADPHATNVREVLWQGLLGGVISGLVFSMVASGAAMLMGKSWDAPVRLVAAVALGPEAPQTGYPLLPSLAWGMALHMAYSAASGVLFGWLVAAFSALRRSAPATIGAGLMYALLMWLLGFYVIAPLFGWTWFPSRTDFLPQFVLQVLVWGGSLGGYFARKAMRQQLSEGHGLVKRVR